MISLLYCSGDGVTGDGDGDGVTDVEEDYQSLTGDNNTFCLFDVSRRQIIGVQIAVTMYQFNLLPAATAPSHPIPE